MLGLLLLATAGCRTFSPRSLDQNVVDARQASLQGLDAMQQERWDEAERIFASAVKACPVDERARGCYAETLWRRGSCDEALGHMQEAVKLSNGDPQRLVQLGEMHLALKQLKEAGERADEAIAKNCRLSSAWALRGDVHMGRGQYNEALADYHRSLAYSEHQPRVQMNVAHIYRRQERPQRALSTLETLAEQFPPGEVPVEVIAMQGMSLKQLGRHQDAVQQLAQAAALGTPSSDLLYHLAEAQFLAGDASGAQASLDTALAQDPRHTAGLQLRTHLLEKQQGLTARLDSDSETVVR
jgi:tetratricopeptide (TPR) repeat protein